MVNYMDGQLREYVQRAFDAGWSMTALARWMGVKPQMLRRWWHWEVRVLTMKNFDILTYGFDVRLTAPKIPDPRKRVYRPRRKSRRGTPKQG